MSELTIAVLRIGFIILLWAFVFAVLGVLRNDLFGTAMVNRRKANVDGKGRQDAPQRRAAPAQTTNILAVTEGHLRGTTLTLHGAPVLIGRASECTFVLDDDYASNKHARIFKDGDTWMVEDLGSTNGTLLNGQEVRGPVPFPVGATLKIGNTSFDMRRGAR